MNRRKFLKYAGLAGGITLFPGVLYAADASSRFNDFKAIVTVDLQGGNDALNTFIPTGSDSKTGYQKYYDERGSSIAIQDTDLMDKLRNLSQNGKLEIASPSDNPYYENKDVQKSYMKGFYLLDNYFDSKIAINGLMPEIAYWMDKGRGVVVQNMGTIGGNYTKSELKADKSKLPPSLFAHNLQHYLAHIGEAKSFNVPTGWLGRLADIWGNVNNDPVYHMNINLSGYGEERAMFGSKTTAMNYSFRGPIPLDKSLDKSFEEWLNSKPLNDGMFKNLYSQLRKSSFIETVTTLKDWNDILENNPFENVTDAYGNEIYKNQVVNKTQIGLETIINTRIIESFKTAARLIAIAKKKGFKRIALSIVMGGYDQHSSLKKDHANRLRNLSLGIDVFMRAMEEINALDEVVLISLSEFSRSTATNGDGSDHAWGGAQFVLGAVNPGNYGEFPDLTVGGGQDISSRGRLIPTTSYSQYYGTVLKWFGATEDEIDHALPELSNFSTRDIGFMA